MTNKQKSLVGGISILGIAGLICKIVGVLYKIPLARTIGPMGMGVYHLVFPTYNLLLTISSAGIPVAISRMVAGYLARGEKQNAKSVFEVALLLLSALGLVGTLVMVLLSPLLAGVKGTAEASISFIAIAPSLLFVCVMSAFRGFMQGRRRMAPTAISQLIEQVGKVFIAMPFAAAGMARGGHIWGAAGALAGTSVAELLALIYMMIDRRFAKNEFDLLPDVGGETEGRKSLARKLLFISLPITIGACIVPIAGEVDAAMLVRMMSAYIPKHEALIYYGTYTGLVFPLINVPTALAMATATTLVPAISIAYEKKDRAAIARESLTGLRIASVIGIPSSVGLSLLAKPILFVLFSGKEYTAQQLMKGAALLQISALTIFLFTLVQTTSGILQGLHKQRIPMYTLALGVAMKIILNYSLVRIPSVNIYGAPFASLLCYATSLAPNLYYVEKYGKVKLKWDEVLWRPLAASLLMGAFILGAKALLNRRLNHSVLWLGLVLMLAIAVYFAAAVAVKALRREDIPARFRRKK